MYQRLKTCSYWEAIRSDLTAHLLHPDSLLTFKTCMHTHTHTEPLIELLQLQLTTTTHSLLFEIVNRRNHQGTFSFPVIAFFFGLNEHLTTDWQWGLRVMGTRPVGLMGSFDFALSCWWWLGFLAQLVNKSWMPTCSFHQAPVALIKAICTAFKEHSGTF